MAAHTLSSARGVVALMLDDPNNRRWSLTQIDGALQDALSLCVNTYAAEGGDQFDVEVDVTTDATGLGSLTFPVGLIRGVQVFTGTVYYPINAQNRSQRVVLDNSARTLKVLAVREYQLPTTTSHPLIGDGATVAPGTWHSFERWVCCEAARALGVTDNDKRPGLEELAQRAKEGAMVRANTYTSRPLPDPEAPLLYASWWRRLGYIMTPSQTAPTIQLVSDVGRWV